MPMKASRFDGDVLPIGGPLSPPQRVLSYPIQLETRFMMYVLSPAAPEDAAYLNLSRHPMPGSAENSFI